MNAATTTKKQGGRKNGMSSMEMESSPHPQQQEQQHQPTTTTTMPVSSMFVFWQSLWALMVAYACYYRGISSTILAFVLILCVILILESIASHATSSSSKLLHHLTRDYSSIPSLYELKMAKIDHWCLMGGDSNCRCDDPTVPLSREEVKGWTNAHVVNTKLVGTSSSIDTWDVVLLGDDAVQGFSGRNVSSFQKELEGPWKFWNETFVNGDMDGLALGIAGDTISNLLWRIQHDELPQNAYVYWIEIGSNDFSYGQCSEEAVLLGILELAERIHVNNPDSVIVLNSILPRQDDVIGNNKNNNKKKGTIPLWNAIKEVNAQMEAFCVQHEHLVYFDASPLFVVTKQGKNGETRFRNNLFAADRVHLSTAGYEAWGNAIADRLKLLLYEDDESSE